MNGITGIFGIPEIPKIPKSTTISEKNSKKNFWIKNSEKNFQFFFQFFKVWCKIPKLPENTEIRDPEIPKTQENTENFAKILKNSKKSLKNFFVIFFWNLYQEMKYCSVFSGMFGIFGIIELRYLGIPNFGISRYFRYFGIPIPALVTRDLTTDSQPRTTDTRWRNP